MLSLKKRKSLLYLAMISLGVVGAFGCLNQDTYGYGSDWPYYADEGYGYGSDWPDYADDGYGYGSDWPYYADDGYGYGSDWPYYADDGYGYGSDWPYYADDGYGYGSDWPYYADDGYGYGSDWPYYADEGYGYGSDWPYYADEGYSEQPIRNLGFLGGSPGISSPGKNIVDENGRPNIETMRNLELRRKQRVIQRVRQTEKRKSRAEWNRDSRTRAVQAISRDMRLKNPAPSKPLNSREEIESLRTEVRYRRNHPRSSNSRTSPNSREIRVRSIRYQYRSDLRESEYSLALQRLEPRRRADVFCC